MYFDLPVFTEVAFKSHLGNKNKKEILRY